MSKYEKFEPFEFDEYNEFETYNEGSSLRKKRRPRKKQKQKKQSGINPFLIGFILLSFVAAFLRQINSSLHGDSAQGEIEEYKEIIDSYARQQESKKVRNNIVPNDRVNSIRNLFQRGLISHQAIDHFQHLYDQLDFSNNDEVNNLSDFTSRLLYDEKFGEDVYNRTDAKDLYEDPVLFNGANVAKIEGPDLLHIDPELEAEFSDTDRLKSLISQAAPLKSDGSLSIELLAGATHSENEKIADFIKTVRNDYKGKYAVVKNPHVDNEKVVIFPDGEFTRIQDITTEDDSFFLQLVRHLFTE